ncbi:hypothetical protein Tsubulata_041775 [Turnera subulata]|uniref:S-protein homolog n=1 Tax=Turnera subulata TaxID=218843 RepID=A0A9Q0JAW0_9ROSI|nr:hypothetical protein Tsubulata_041775 [Turnera subulata]
MMHHLLLTFLSLLLFSFTITLCAAKTKVHIKNTLEGGQVLNFHCKSKNDDLGVQLLHPGEEWMFRFTVNIWETTLYFCRFWWGAESHWFDIYKASRDKWPPVCYDDNKYWEVKQSGPCFIRCFASPHQTCYPWNS